MTWRDKIKENCVYRLGNGTYSGPKGALSYGEILENNAMSDLQIQENIARSDKTELVKDNVYIKLINLKE